MKAARDLGGPLNVESVGPGGGSTFILDLPLKPPEMAHG
jgi:signal transduction histidine kinase